MNRSSGGWSVKRFERYIGLDTALYKKIPFPLIHPFHIPSFLHKSAPKFQKKTRKAKEVEGVESDDDDEEEEAVTGKPKMKMGFQMLGDLDDNDSPAEVGQRVASLVRRMICHKN